MAKVWNYIIITTGLVLLFQLAGIPTGAQTLLNFVGLGTSSAELNTSSFWDAIFGPTGILIAAVVVGIFVGFLTRGHPENFIIYPLIGGSLALYLSSLQSIINYTVSNAPVWVSTIVLIVLGTLGVGYLLALVEFFRGTD